MAEEGGAVYLTQYLKDGLIQEAQLASRVTLPLAGEECDLADLPSWAGYLSVGSNFSSHVFFWYFVCLDLGLLSEGDDSVSSTNNSTAPLLIWLNGGPGISSTVGLFEEVGPFKILPSGRVTSRNESWTKHFDLLFIDNPMATGFSYNENGEKTQSVKESGENLYEFLKQFYQLFSQTKQKDLYIGGQSYGAMFATEFAALVKTDNSINLKGIFTGSGLLHPSLMLPLFPDYMESVGLYSKGKSDEIRQLLLKALQEHEINPQEATETILKCIFVQTKELIGFGSMENIMDSTLSQPWASEAYLNNSSVQRAIHVRPTDFKSMNRDVLDGMAADFLTGVQYSFQSLLNSNLKVLVFHGQMDPIVTVQMTNRFLSNLLWSGSHEYCSVKEKLVWRDRAGQVAGYVTQASNLMQVVIRNAGHRTAINQPSWVLDMMKRFVNNMTFSD